MRFHGDKDSELREAREGLLALVHVFGGRLDEMAVRLDKLTATVEESDRRVAAQIAGLPREFDATGTLAAVEIVKSAHEQIGVLQRTVSLLSDDEQLIELANEMACAGFEAQSAEHGADDASD